MKGSAGKGRGVTVGAVILHLLPAFLVCGVFAAVGIIHVTSRVMVVGVGYSLSKLEAENRDLVRENDRLKLELATLKSPNRLEAAARTQLGMIRPPAGTVISISESESPEPKKTPVKVERSESKPIVVSSNGRRTASTSLSRPISPFDFAQGDRVRSSDSLSRPVSPFDFAQGDR